MLRRKIIGNILTDPDHGVAVDNSIEWKRFIGGALDMKDLELNIVSKKQLLGCRRWGQLRKGESCRRTPEEPKKGSTIHHLRPE